MWTTTSLGADAFLLVYDITSPESLEQCLDFDTHIQTEYANRLEQRRCWPALMVVGNKADLATSREISAKQGLDWARARGYGFMETSAREMVNVEETLEALVRRVVAAREMHARGDMPLAPTTPVRISAPTDSLMDEKSGLRSRDESPHLRARPGRKPPSRWRPIWDWWLAHKCW